MAVGQNPVPTVNISIPTKIGSKIGGAPTKVGSQNGFDHSQTKRDGPKRGALGPSATASARLRCSSTARLSASALSSNGAQKREAPKWVALANGTKD